MSCLYMKIDSMKMFGALLVMFMTACGTISPETPVETPTDPDVPETPELPEISPDSTWMSFKPELEFGEEPLLKSGDIHNDLYLVGVAQIVPFDESDGSDNLCYRRYAWGYFDNLDLAVFKLSKMHNYSFVMAYIPDGKSQIYRHSNGSYGCPFEVWCGGSAKFVNEIYYDVDGYEKWPTLDEGKASTPKRKEGKSWSSIVRYQGVVERVDPSKHNSITVKLYRMMIGFKITIDDFTEGVVEVSGDESYKVYPASGKTSNTLEFEIQTPTMPMWGFESGFGAGESVISADEYNGYSQEELENRILDNINYGRTGINISYTDKSGTKISLYTKQQFFYKRNTKYTLRFSLSDAISNGGIIPEVVDDGEMEEKSLLQ